MTAGDRGVILFKMDYPIEQTAELIKLAIAEDIGDGDITSMALVPADARIDARIVAKENGILCGGPAVEQVYSIIAGGVVVEPLVVDGTPIGRGDEVIRVSGPARAVLAGERTAMNLLCHLAGIATMASRFVREIEGTGCRILDTRKTMPGMRAVEKYAVEIGGGTNHRMGLWDMILVKENHIAAAGGFRRAMERLFATDPPSVPVEVEVRNRDELAIAMDYPVDRIMLDNFTVDGVKDALRLRAKRRIDIPFEASGGITLENCRRYAETGIEFISSGALTHSVEALDFTMVAEEPR